MNRMTPLVAIACAALTGCAQGNKSVSDLNATATGTLQNTARLTQDTFTFVTDQPMAYVEVGSEGTTAAGPGPLGTASITEGGIVTTDPKNTSADRIHVTFGEPVITDDGRVIVPVASVEVEGLNANISEVILAEASRQAQAKLPAFLAMEETQRQVALAQLEASQSIIDNVVAAIIRAALGMP